MTAPAFWRPIAEAPQDGTRLMLWDSVSKRPVFGSWWGDNPKITHLRPSRLARRCLLDGPQPDRERGPQKARTE